MTITIKINEESIVVSSIIVIILAAWLIENEFMSVFLYGLGYGVILPYTIKRIIQTNKGE